MDISADKTKLMTNSKAPIKSKVTVCGHQFETVTQFRYLSTFISEGDSKTEELTTAPRSTIALVRLTCRDKNISFRSKLELLNSPVFFSLIPYMPARPNLTNQNFRDKFKQ